MRYLPPVWLFVGSSLGAWVATVGIREASGPSQVAAAVVTGAVLAVVPAVLARAFETLAAPAGVRDTGNVTAAVSAQP